MEPRSPESRMRRLEVAIKVYDTRRDSVIQWYNMTGKEARGQNEQFLC